MKPWQIVVGVGVVVAGVAIIAQLGSSSDEHCMTVTVDEDAVSRMIRAQVDGSISAGLSASSPALLLMRRIVKKGWPHCAWADTDTTQIVGPEGTVSWPAVVAALKGKTIADIANDPSLGTLWGAVSNNLPGREGASADAPERLGDIISSIAQSIA